SLADIGREMSGPPDDRSQEPRRDDEETLDAPQAVVLLSERLSGYFDEGTPVRVRLSDGIVADAAAGCDYIKIRQDARFSPRRAPCASWRSTKAGSTWGRRSTAPASRSARSWARDRRRRRLRRRGWRC